MIVVRELQNFGDLLGALHVDDCCRDRLGVDFVNLLEFAVPVIAALLQNGFVRDDLVLAEDVLHAFYDFFSCQCH